MQYVFSEPDVLSAFFAAPLALGLLWIGGTTLLCHLLNFDQAWQLCLGILTLGCLYNARLYQPREAEPKPITRWEAAGLLLLVGLCYFVVHTREMLAPEDDFFIHFPEIALLSRGCIPPVNPFLPEFTLMGHFGRDLWLAILSRLNGNDILAATWGLNHALQILCIGLSWRVGRSQLGPSRSLLLPWFLFCGISVGSRVGLLDTYDNNNALVYAGVVLFLYLFEKAQNTSCWLWTGVLLGCYTIVYETHALLLLLVLAGLSLLQRRNHKQHLACATLALSLGACLGGPLQDLALRVVGARQANLGHQEVYEGQRVQVHFPKQKLLQIDLGAESYRRQSYVLQMPLFEKILPPLDAGGYTYIWHPKVLQIHWFSTWLGLWCGLWLWRRRHWQGLSYWLFGWLSFLTPALVDFGALHEKEYFRWEFAAGFGFAGALALTLADRHSLKGMWPVLIVVTLWGGEKRVNECLIEIQRCERLSGPVLRQQHLRQLFYPTSQDWLLSHQAFHLSKDQIEIARQLREKLPVNRREGKSLPRVLTDIDARDRDSLGQESVLAALMAAPIVGHQGPPRWMPDGIAPYFHSPAWSAYWYASNDSALSALGADAVLRTQSQSRVLPRVNLEQGQCQVQFLASGEVQSPGKLLTEVSRLQAPAHFAVDAQPEWPSQIELKVDGSAEINKLEGWLPVVLHCSGNAQDPPTQLPQRLQFHNGVAQLVFVPPLHRGPTHWKLEMAESGKMLAEGEWQSRLAGLSPFEAWLAQVHGEVREHDHDLQIELSSQAKEGPYRLGLRYFNGERSSYETPFGFATTVGFRFTGNKVVQQLPLKRDFFVHPQSRVDVFLISYAGWEQMIGQYQPQTQPQTQPRTR